MRSDSKLDSELPAPNPKRQAAHTISAFRFQLLETAIAWMNLSEAETLLIEIFEDFDVKSENGGAKLTQVKHSASDRVLTLASKDARDALENFWTVSHGGQAQDLSLVVHTNMSIGTEHAAHLPGEIAGIEYWQAVKNGAAAAPLKDLLLAILPAGNLKSWLVSVQDDHTLRAQFFNRVDWKTNQLSGVPQRALLAELITGRLAALELPVGLAPNAAGSIVDYIFAVASEKDASLRRLTTTDLHTFLREVCRSGQPGHEVGWARASWTVAVEEIALPAYVASRAPLVGELSDALAENGALWLHGASGTGKSTLAQQVARASGKHWLVVELRGLSEASDVLLRLDRAYTDITLGGDIRGVILDDMSADIVARYATRLGRFINWMRNRAGSVIVTSARTLSPATFQLATLSLASEKDAPYLSVEETTELIAQTSAPPDQVEAWGLFINVSTSGGHPQLTAAKVVSLEHRGWPKDALVEDFSGGVSEAVELTRSEARRRLLEDATDHGRALLKRLGCIMLKFDRASAIAIAGLDPAIQEPSASLDMLTGPWIERVPSAPGYLRLSPLLLKLQEDLGEETILRIQTEYLLSTIKRGPIPYEALDSVFWTAFVSKQGWFFAKLFENSLSFEKDKSKAIATKLGGLVYLRTDQPLLPDDLGTSHILRLLQVDVAALNGENTLFQSIALATMREALAVENLELRNALSLMALFRILLAQGTKLDWGLRLSYIAYFEMLANNDPDLINRNESPAIKAMQAEFGEAADIGGFMLHVGASAIENPSELKSLLMALGELEPALRDRRLLQLKSFFNGYGLHVQSAWVRAWSAGKIDVDGAIAQYRDMAIIAARWRDDDLVAECIVAQSVLWDEFKDNRATAIETIDTALEAHPAHPDLLRQKAKVLGHDRQYDMARLILESIRERTDASSDIERMYTLKEQAVATANLGDLGAARILFLEAASAAEAVQEDIVSVHAHGVALRAEAAMCFWRNGDVEPALRELAPLVGTLEQIDPDTHSAAKNLHRKLRWLVGWLHERTNGPSGLDRELHFGALAALDAEYPDEDNDQSNRLEDLKLLLTIVGLRQEVRDLFPDIDWSKTTTGFHIFLAAAEFDLAIETGSTEEVVDALLQLVVAFVAALGQVNEPRISAADKVDRIEASDLESPVIVDVLVHAFSLAAFFGAHRRGDKRDYCESLLKKTEERLEVTPPELRRFGEILSDGAAIRWDNHAERIFSFAFASISEVLHPADILNRQLSLLRCAASCGGGARTIIHIHTIFANEWAFVIEHQRFLLTQPSLHVPVIEAAIRYTREGKAGALRNLLQTGARSLNAQVPDSWFDLAERMGGTAKA